jgi:hypothetical protein
MKLKYTKDPNTVTLEDAKVWLRKVVKKGAECPCCTRHAQVYERKFNAGMACVLIYIFNTANELQPPGGWFHINNELAKRQVSAMALEYSKLRHWGMIEKYPKGEKGPGGQPSSGLWRITPLGRGFVAGMEKVERVQRVYDNQVLKSAAKEQITIKQALADGFDYDELMSGKIAHL